MTFLVPAVELEALLERRQVIREEYSDEQKEQEAQTSGQQRCETRCGGSCISYGQNCEGGLLTLFLRPVLALSERKTRISDLPQDDFLCCHMV